MHTTTSQFVRAVKQRDCNARTNDEQYTRITRALEMKLLDRLLNWLVPDHGKSVETLDTMINDTQQLKQNFDEATARFNGESGWKLDPDDIRMEKENG